VCVCVCVRVCVLNSIDATADDVAAYGLARFMNHSRAHANLKGHLVMDRFHQLHVCFQAVRDIEAGEALLIDYGDRRKMVVASFPWLKQ
jgi:SET domain-containing protein